MAMETSRSVLRRLPVLVALLWALLAAPHLVAAPVHPASGLGASSRASVVAAPAPQAQSQSQPAVIEDREPGAERAPDPVTEHPLALAPQLAAGTSGSRAPPAAAV